MTDDPSDLEPEALIRMGWIEILNQGRLERLHEFYAEDAVYYDTLGRQGDIDDLKDDLRPFFAGFSNLHGTLGEVIVDDDEMAFQYTMGGTHTDEFEGVPATGAEVEVPGIGYARLEDGLVAEYRIVFDNLGMFRQIDVL